LPPPPPTAIFFRKRCRSRGIGCKCRIRIRPKGQIIQLEKIGARPHPPRLQYLRRSGAPRKRTQTNQILDTRTNIAAHSRARSKLRRSLGRAVFRLVARSLDRRAFVCSQGTNNGSPPLPTGLRKRFPVVCPHAVIGAYIIPEFGPLDPP
jgi:hypothetical protein